MKKNEAFPSRFLKAADLNDEPRVVVIHEVNHEVLKWKGKEEQKTVLYFVGKTKPLPLNKTNWTAVEKITGEADDENWPEHEIELYPTTTPLADEIVDCVRVRAPGEKPEQKKKTARPKLVASGDSENPSADMDDEIPF